jgi:hypothetical protein
MGEDEPVKVNPSGVEVTVYPLMADPPLRMGAVNSTETWPLPGVPATAVGAPGTVIGARGLTGEDAFETGPGPTALVAVRVKV